MAPPLLFECKLKEVDADWEPVDEETVRRVLANNYHDVQLILSSMEEGLYAPTNFARYRLIPTFTY